MNRQPPARCHVLAALGAGLTLLAPGGLRADTLYRIQPIMKLGDRIGEIRIDPSGDIEVGALNDNGQIAFVTENAAAGAGEMVIQYSDGKLIPIVVAGRDAPGGTWSKPVSVFGPVTMNQRGNVAFAVEIMIGNSTAPGTFLWDPTAAKTSAVALRGMPVGNLTFEAGGYFNPSINNSGEIAFPAFVKNAAGEPRPGIFFLGRDQQLRPVILPDQELPGGGRAALAHYPTLNDAGAVAFLVPRPAERVTSAFLWENGQITPLAVIDADLPGGGKIATAEAALVNNKSRSVLLAVGRRGSSAFGLYRYGDGQLTPVVSPGQVMPDGGTFRNLLYPDGAFPLFAISPANELGHHAFLATVTAAGAIRSAAYRLDPDGTLSLILKSGTPTDLGPITAIGPPSSDPPSFGVAINNKGQVALPVSFGNGPVTLVLLTPAAP